MTYRKIERFSVSFTNNTTLNAQVFVRYVFFGSPSSASSSVFLTDSSDSRLVSRHIMMICLLIFDRVV